MTVWSDDRLEAALAGLADDLAVPTGPLLVGRARVPRRPVRGRWVLAAAAVVVAVALVVAAVPAGRRAVAGWLGLGRVTVERVDPDLTRPTAGFVDGVDEIPLDQALATVGLDSSALADAGLGRPETAGRPPEGGVVLAWDGGRTTLWVRRPDQGDDALLVKRLLTEAIAETVIGLGDAALLVDGDHVLTTPARTVAADRVLWWIADHVEHRLETDRPAAELVAIGRTLAG